MANWGKLTGSGDVEDRRGFAPVAGGLSITGIVLIIAVNYFMGGNVGDVLQQISGMSNTSTEQRKVTDQYDGSDEYEMFASRVLGSNNDLWKAQFKANGRQYEDPKLVLFRTATDSACGGADARVGPHYCPLDKTIYLDETFFDELTTRLGAKGGDVAQAYVISHEVGHHVQNQLDALNQDNSNEGSIRVELQADCYAGMWAHSIRDQNILEPGEISEAMDAAAAVGDDRIQERVTGYVNSESWTHGSSEQRLHWFTEGYEKGSISACNTSK